MTVICRQFILDALTTLLADRRADEVTTRDIAAVAGVSERTVYRHFPDPDPRRFAANTQDNTREIRELFARGLPELSKREQLRIAAVIRCSVSTQAWLRMREQFTPSTA